MTVNFTLAVRTNVNTFKDTASKGDVVRYSIDCTPWAEDAGGTVTSVAASVEHGSASISNETLVSGVWSADVTFTERGRVQISALVNTATVKKKAFIDVKVEDLTQGDDYGQGCC